VRRLHPAAVLPARAHRWDAGLDLVSVRDLELPAGGRAVAPTGIAVAVPDGWVGLVAPRSGLARRHGIGLVNAPGVIDAGYRGELEVLLANHGREAVRLAAGTRIAQLVLVPAWTGAVVEVDDLPPGDGRGAGGFGSSGT